MMPPVTPARGGSACSGRLMVQNLHPLGEKPDMLSSRRTALLLCALLLACVEDARETDTPADGTHETFPCDPNADGPTFEHVHGDIDGYVLVPWYDPAGGEAGVVVVDAAGCTRWSAEVDPYVTSARWQDEVIWFNQMGDDAALHRVDMVTGEEALLETPHGHHDFLLHPDGTVAWLVEEIRTVDDEEVLGDLLRELRPDGSVVDVWNAFDSLPIERHDQWDLLNLRDWTHANGLAYDHASDTYIVSLYWLSEVIAVDRRSGAVTRRLKGDTLADPFGRQHAPSAMPGGGLRLFDNTGIGEGSRLLDLTWDGQVTWEWNTLDNLGSPVLGDLLVREDNVALASFGAEGVVLAVTEGVETWRIAAPGVVIGRLDWRAELPD